MNPVTIDRESEIIFTNFTDEMFEGQWNKKIWVLEAHDSYSLPFYLAQHFAKGLVDRELNRLAHIDLDKQPLADAKLREAIEGRVIGNLGLRQQLMDKCADLTPKEGQEISVIRPRALPRQEIKLKTDERTEEMIETGKIAPGTGRARGPAKTGDSDF